MPSVTPLPNRILATNSSSVICYYPLSELITGTVTSVSNVDGTVTVAPTTGDVVVSLPSIGTLTPGSYTNADITVDAYGRVTVAANGSPSGTGTVTRIDITPGTGISASGGPITTSGSITVTNTAPDQVVVLSNGTGISVTGTYPNFTITNTAPYSPPNLNTVLGIGNTSATSVVIVSGAASSTVSTGSVAVTNGSTITSITPNQVLYKQAIYQGALMSATLFSNQVWTLPNNTGTVALTSDIPSVTPAALTKTDDTNITLTLGGTPATALLQAVSITAGWAGTLADGRIASASTWNAKQDALSGTGFVKSTAGTISYDTSTYIASGSTAGGDLTGTYPNPTFAVQSVKKGGVSAAFNGQGGVITSGTIATVVMNYAGTLTGWYIASFNNSTGVLLSGSCTIAITKNGTDIITTGTAPSLSSQSTNSGTNMTNWTTAFSSGDYFVITINSVTTCQNVTLTLNTTKT